VNIFSEFGFRVMACAFLSILFWVACAGIGLQIVPRRPGGDVEHEDEQPSRRGAGVAAVVGLGALLMIAGVALLLRVPWWLYVIPFVVAGLAFAIREVVGLDGGRQFSRAGFVVALFAAAALVVVALLESTAGLRYRLNLCDDVRAYLPMAQRFLDTYGLDEPWSARRAQSMGGFDLLRAMPVSFFGTAGAGVAETAIATVFVAGFFIGNGLRSLALRLLGVGLVLALALIWVPRVNTTGVLFGAPLVAAVLAATAETRAALRRRDMGGAFRWSIAAGLVVAALTSIRPNLGFFGVVLLGLGIVVTRSRVSERLAVLGAGGATSFLAVAPWSFAMWRTVGTPIYPLFMGNLNTPALARPPIGTFSHRVDLAVDLLRNGPYLWVVLGVILFAVVGWRFLADPLMVVIGAGATLFVSALLALQTPLLGAFPFARYTAPMCEGLAVFLLFETLRGADLAARRGTVRVPAVVARVAGVLLVIALAALTFSPVGFKGWPLDAGPQFIASALRNEVPWTADVYDTPATKDAYRDALESVVGYRTISALEQPYLIDYRRFDIPNLDAPGYMTPDGDFPFFTGPGPKLDKLRRAGFDVLLVTDPASERCLTPGRMEVGAESDLPTSGIYRRFLDWEQDIQAVTQQAPAAVRRFGTVLRIDLHAAEAALSS
jgi:hypothetical protein